MLYCAQEKWKRARGLFRRAPFGGIDMSETTKILIVDDDPDIRNVLNLLLRSD